MTEPVDTGFDAVLAGERWEPPKEETLPPSDGAIYAAVSQRDDPAAHARIAESIAEVAMAINDVLTPPVTATVTEAPASAPVVVNDATVQAAKALVHLPHISTVELAKLAREIAMDVKERHVIIKEFGLTQTQYDYLETYNDFFKQALQAACIEWHAPLSTPERIRVEAAAILEDSLPGLGARMQNKSEGLPGVIEAAKVFAKIAGVGERETGGGSVGERFVINIDLGGDQKISVSTGEANPSATAQPLSPRPLRQDG